MANERNLSLVLRRVHRDGPASRAQLTRETGLNRSTVAALVAELVGRGLVVEEPPDVTRQVGRPSPVVRSSRSVLAVAVVPEVDSVTVGLVELTGTVRAKVRLEVVDVPSVGEAVRLVGRGLEELLGGLAERDRVAGVGVAVPGLVRSGDGEVRWAPHLNWRDEPLAAELAEATGRLVLAGNDANLGARAEHLFGAARGTSHVLYLNGGPSGIGGGIVVDGEMLLGADGYAGEFGHSRLTGAGAGEGAELEALVSRRRLLRVLGLEGASDEVLAQALGSADAAAVHQEVRRQLEALAAGVRDMINVLNPQRVVLGGFLGPLFERDPQHFLDHVRAQALGPSWESVTVVRAALGADLLLVGAAELVFERVIDQACSRPSLQR